MILELEREMTGRHCPSGRAGSQGPDPGIHPVLLQEEASALALHPRPNTQTLHEMSSYLEILGYKPLLKQQV